MQQYFDRHDPFTVDNIKNASITKFDNKLFANERPDAKFIFENMTITNTTFAKMGFKGSKFTQMNLSFCVFIDCYFRQATFNNVIFNGCIFINCNFEKTIFVCCDFTYAKFKDCYVKFEDMVNNLPTKENLRWNLCKELSIECLHSGDSTEYRKYFFEEKRASEKYYIKKLIHPNNDLYYKKYNWVDGLNGLGNYILSKVNKYLWGYGEKLTRLIVNIILTIVIFSFLFYTQVNKMISLSDKVHAHGFWNSVYISSCNFFTVSSDYSSSSPIIRFISTAEGAIGIVLMGFFIAALFRFINRRG
jgi:hypothetical protein